MLPGNDMYIICNAMEYTISGALLMHRETYLYILYICTIHDVNRAGECKHTMIRYTVLLIKAYQTVSTSIFTIFVDLVK